MQLILGVTDKPAFQACNNKSTDQLSFDKVGSAPYRVFVGMIMQPTHEVRYLVLRACVYVKRDISQTAICTSVAPI